MPQPHTAHAFDREVSRSLERGDQRAIYGCTFGRCAETEIRDRGAPSPFAIRRRQDREAAARKGRRV